MSPARIGHMVPTGLEGDLVIFLIPVAMPPARLFIIVPYYSNKPTPQNSCLQSLPPSQHNAASRDRVNTVFLIPVAISPMQN